MHHETLNVLLLSLVNHPSDNDIKTAINLVLLALFKHSKSTPIPNRQTTNPSHSKPQHRARIPNELVYDIVDKISSQHELARLTTINSTWYAIASKKLYQSPTISSMSQFSQITSASTYSTETKTILFEPCMSGSLSNNLEYATPELNSFHSSLFRAMVQLDTTIPSQTVFSLISTFPNLEFIKESNVAKSDTSKTINREAEYTYSNVLLQKYFDKCIALQHASLSALGTPFDIETYSTLCIRLLQLSQYNRVDDLFEIQLQYRPILQSQAITLLKALTASILAQIQYMTFCSQRLLDCYAIGTPTRYRFLTK